MFPTVGKRSEEHRTPLEVSIDDAYHRGHFTKAADLEAALALEPELDGADLEEEADDEFRGRWCSLEAMLENTWWRVLHDGHNLFGDDGPLLEEIAGHLRQSCWLFAHNGGHLHPRQLHCTDVQILEAAQDCYLRRRDLAARYKKAAADPRARANNERCYAFARTHSVSGAH